MVIHRRTRLTPLQREAVYRQYKEDKATVSGLAREYHVSRPTIYKIIKRGRSEDLTIHRSGSILPLTGPTNLNVLSIPTTGHTLERILST